MNKHESRCTLSGRLALHVPSIDDLGYRQKLMSDPDTMSYNRGYELSFPGYHPDTGCIDFPENEWQEWHDYFIGQEPTRFYAYIVRKEDGAFIGEVNVHRNSDQPWYEMGIVIEARHRGRGYAAEALRLLLAHAFEIMGVEAVHNDFEDVRDAAVKAHLAAGFTKYRREGNILELMITREQYFALTGKE